MMKSSLSRYSKFKIPENVDIHSIRSFKNITFSMEDCNKLRWLGVDDCKDEKVGSVLLCINSAISPFPSLILDEIMSNGD